MERKHLVLSVIMKPHGLKIAVQIFAIKVNEDEFARALAIISGDRL
jgi:hypothetical protein